MEHPSNTFTGYDCGIFYQKDGVLIGGSTFGLQDQLEMRLCVYPHENRLVLRIYLQRQSYVPEVYFDVSGHPHGKLGIGLEFPAGTWKCTGERLPEEDHTRLFGTNPHNRYCLVRLESTCLPLVEGLGLLFRREPAGSLEIGGFDDKIKGSRSLRDIMSQKDFHFVIEDRHLPQVVKGFGLSGDVQSQSGQNDDRHHSANNPDTNEIVKQPNPKIAARDCYQTSDNVFRALKKSAKREGFWIDIQVEALGEIDCTVRFGKIREEVIATVTFPEIMVHKIWDLAPYFAREGSKVMIGFYDNERYITVPGFLATRVVASSDGVFRVRIFPPPAVTNPSQASLIHRLVSLKHTKGGKLHFIRKLHERRVAAAHDVFQADLAGRSDEDQAANRLLQELLIGGTSGRIIGNLPEFPRFDLVGDTPPAYLTALETYILGGNRNRYVNYVRARARLGLLGAVGHNTRGQLAFTTVLFTANSSIGKVFVAAPTAQYLLEVARAIDDCGRRTKRESQTQKEAPVVVVGREIDFEISEFVRGISSFRLPGRFDYTVCGWLRRVLEMDNLHQPINQPELMTIRANFRRDAKYSHLRDVVDGGWAFCQDKDQLEHIKGLMQSIITAADVVCTSVPVCREQPYDEVRRKAKGFILDNATSMSRNDALVVLGDCFKPTAMFGDMCEKVETFVDERHNEFFEDAELSIFKFIMRSGHPVFHVNQWVKALVEEC